ncbi:hypothetical protein PIB30_004623 [Stylosanthes scabra]|uniref:Uncharacterized protein n=1 Tax=Stylosanthes scabra TaxID=79078 RepID=A0ABU6Z0V5_9FABA|nr:hypothetical protein [Stylosanthes scabra]
MISGGIPDEGNPPSKKAAKRSKHSCLAVEVMPRPLAGNPPPAIVFSSEEIRQNNQQHEPTTESDLEAHSDDLVEFSGERVTPESFVTLWVSIGNPRTQETLRSDG